MNNLFAIALATALATTLAACGGGGSSTPTTTAATAAAPAPAASAPAPIQVFTTQTVTGPSPIVSTAADCPRLLDQAQAVAQLQIIGVDMQQVATVLQATSPGQGYQLFARMPATMMWWVRSLVAKGAAMDMATVGTAVHETEHEFDAAVRKVCNSDGRARYMLDGTINVTDLQTGQGGTSQYSIASETIPASYSSVTSNFRYPTYITGVGKGSDFSMALDELTAYTAGAEFEIGLLSNLSYTALHRVGDFNAGGQVDFMLYTLAYLQAARLNHPLTYASIQSQTNTILYLQALWSRAEANLVALYPYTDLAPPGPGGLVGPAFVSKSTLATIYSPSFIIELDRLGITHQPASAWSTTYLR